MTQDLRQGAFRAGITLPIGRHRSGRAALDMPPSYRICEVDRRQVGHRSTDITGGDCASAARKVIGPSTAHEPYRNPRWEGRGASLPEHWS